MRQSFGKFVELLASTAAANGVPSGDAAGVAVADIKSSTGGLAAAKHVLAVDMGNTGSAELHIWGYRNVTGTAAWYALGPDDGVINDGSAVTGTPRQLHMFILENLGGLERVYLEVINVTGTVAIVAHIAEYQESGDHGD